MKIFEITDSQTSDKEKNAQLEKQAAIDFIKAKCSNWIKQCGGKLVFRGVQNLKAGAMTVVNARLDRRPLHSPIYVQNAMNHVIEAAGKVANRSNSFFVSGRWKQAQGYGIVCCAFPIGQFHYTWVPEVSDLFMYGSVKIRLPRIRGVVTSSDLMKADHDHVFYFMEDIMRGHGGEAASQAMKKFIASMNINPEESLIPSPRTSVAVRTFKSRFNLYQEIIGYIEKNLIEHYNALTIKGDDHSLKEAISSGNEILLKADQLVLLPMGMWNEKEIVDMIL